MELTLQTQFSVGLSVSDLSSSSQPTYGTGSNLTLEVQLQFSPSSYEELTGKWKTLLSELHSELDHVHLKFDHSQLKVKNTGESALLDWLVERLKPHTELRGLTLRSPENYTVKWEP